MDHILSGNALENSSNHTVEESEPLASIIFDANLWPEIWKMSCSVLINSSRCVKENGAWADVKC